MTGPSPSSLPLSRPEEERGGFYYGWVITFALFMVLFLFWGTFYSFGVFLKAMAGDFGWSRATVSAAFGLNMLVQGVLGIGAGVLADRFGPRGVVAAGGVLTALGYALMFSMDSLWEFALYYGLMVGAGMSVSYVVPVAAIPRWFERKRGLALGIVMAGVGAGQVALAPLLTGLIALYGWRLTFLIMGAGIGLLSLLVSLLLRPPPFQGPAIGRPSLSLGRAMLTLPFWLLCAIWLLVSMPLQVLQVHIVPMATDLGFSPAAAALILTLMGFSVTLSRVGIGLVSDRFGDRLTYYFCLGVQMAVLFSLALASGLWIFYLAGLVFGIGYGGGAVIYPKIVARVFGLGSLGGIIGVLSLAWYIGAAAGAPLGGLIYDLTGRYSLAFLVSGGVMGMALLIVAGLFRHPRVAEKPG